MEVRLPAPGSSERPAGPEVTVSQQLDIPLWVPRTVGPGSAKWDACCGGQVAFIRHPGRGSSGWGVMERAAGTRIEGKASASFR